MKNLERDPGFFTIREIEEDPRGALLELQRIRRERDTFVYRLNRLDTELNLEAALRERYAQVKKNIEGDMFQADDFAQKTQLRTGEQKRWHKRQMERIQIEWYKHDELSMVAYKAGLDLKANAPKANAPKANAPKANAPKANAPLGGEQKREIVAKFGPTSKAERITTTKGEQS